MAIGKGDYVVDPKTDSVGKVAEVLKYKGDKNRYLLVKWLRGDKSLIRAGAVKPHKK